MSPNRPSYQLQKESEARKEFQNDFQEQQPIKECDYPKELLKDTPLQIASLRAPHTSRVDRQQHDRNRITDVCNELESTGYLSEENAASKALDSSEKEITLVDFMASLNDMQLEFMKNFLETWSQNNTNRGKKEAVSMQQQQYQEILDFFEQNNLDISNVNAFNSAETIVLG